MCIYIYNIHWPQAAGAKRTIGAAGGTEQHPPQGTGAKGTIGGAACGRGRRPESKVQYAREQGPRRPNTSFKNLNKV